MWLFAALTAVVYAAALAAMAVSGVRESARYAPIPDKNPWR